MYHPAQLIRVAASRDPGQGINQVTLRALDRHRRRQRHNPADDLSVH
jgi:hypothetical protein